jgi:hypothetical protein
MTTFADQHHRVTFLTERSVTFGAEWRCAGDLVGACLI